MAITILLLMTVFMLLVNDMIPPTSDVVPLVAKFYTTAMMEMTIALILACYSLSLHHTDPMFVKMPNWIKNHVLGKSSRHVFFSKIRRVSFLPLNLSFWDCELIVTFTKRWAKCGNIEFWLSSFLVKQVRCLTELHSYYICTVIFLL